MRVLTLWEPWATLIAIGAKRIETRSWGTDYRGRLAIHAARRRVDLAVLRSEPFRYVLRHHGIESAEDFGYGSIVCVTSLVDVVPTDGHEILEALRASPSPFERSFGDYGPGRHAWLTGPRPMALPKGAVPWVGAQGLRRAPVALRAAIARALSAAAA